MPYLILGGAQLAVGAAAIFARYALGGAGAIVVSAGRLCIASAVLLVIAALYPDKQALSRDERATLFFAGIALAIHFATWIWSLDYVSVAISLLLVATTPLWTALADLLIYRRALSLRTLAAFALGGAGLSAVIAYNVAPPPHAGHTLLGCALALIGAMAFAAYLVLVRTVRERIELRTIVTHTYTWAALALAGAALVAHQSPPALSNGPAWGGIIAMALVSQLLGHTGMNAALKWFSPNAVAYSTVIEPIIGALLALALFHETLAPLALLGAVIVLGSIIMVLHEEQLHVVA